MANSKISNLPAASALAGTEPLPVVQSAATKQSTISAILTYITANISLAASAITSGTLALARGGTAASLADPNADRIMFWDDSAGAVDWLTAGSGLTITGTTMTASGGAPTDATYITSAANGSLSAEIVIPGLAGSADVAGVGGAGTSREFESGDTAPTWSSAPAATDVGTTFASHLYISRTDNTESFATYAWVPGSGAFDARMKCSYALDSTNINGGAFGMHIQNSDNSLRLTTDIIYTPVTPTVGVRALTYSTTYTQRGSTWAAYSNELYLRITRDGSNNCSFYWSRDGKTWQLIATQALTLTVSHIGFRYANGAALTSYAVVDWLRTSV